MEKHQLHTDRTTFVAGAPTSHRCCLDGQGLTRSSYLTIGPRLGRFSPSFSSLRRSHISKHLIPGFHLCPNWICRHTIELSPSCGGEVYRQLQVNKYPSEGSGEAGLRVLFVPKTPSHLWAETTRSILPIMPQCESWRVLRLRNLSLVVGRKTSSLIRHFCLPLSS
jgi:hypothetical protein